MGWFTNLFTSPPDGGDDVKVQAKNADNSVVRGHHYEKVGDGKHVHHSYSLDRTTGDYKEYHGGENSSDRSYNKR